VRDAKARFDRAIDFAIRFGGIDGDHHKAWVIDQMVRALTGCPVEDGVQGESLQYEELIADACEDDGDPEAYDWEVGIAP
jgi:hypothetical protein